MKFKIDFLILFKIILLFVCTSISNATTLHKKPTIKYNHYFENIDLETARLIYKFYNNPKLFNDEFHVIKINDLIKESILFKHLKNKINVININSCLNSKSHNINNTISKKLNQLFKEHCLYYLLKNSNSKNITKYIYKNISFLLSNEEYLIKTIKYSKRDKKLHENVKNTIISSISGKEKQYYKLIKEINKNKKSKYFSDITFYTKEYLKIVKSILKCLYRKRYNKCNYKIEQILGFIEDHKKFIPLNHIINNLLKINYYLFKVKHYKIALKLSNYILSMDLEQEKKYEVAFIKLIILIKENQIENAYEFIKKNNFAEDYNKLDSRLRYWVAYLFKIRKDINYSKYLFKKQIQLEPTNFYSILSLKNLSPNKLSNLIFKDKYKLTSLKIKNNFNDSFIKLIKTTYLWIDLGYLEFIKLEVNNLINKNKNYMLSKNSIYRNYNIKDIKNALMINIINKLNKRDLQSIALEILINIINDKHISISKQNIKYRFPIYYKNNISKINKKIEPSIILSLIKQESAFNPKAKSPKGALGLMQVILPTAKMINKKITRKKLKTPKTNLKIGIGYLDKLIKKYNGSLVMALIAYNAGQGNLKKWDKLYRLNKENNYLLFIETIPFKETKKYVKLIYRNIFYYKLLDNKYDFKKALTLNIK